MTTLARNSHPQTAKDAGRAMQANKQKRAALIIWAAATVKQHPGRTAAELASIVCPTDPRKIGRRLIEAHREGMVRIGPTRKCSISGRSAQTWEPPHAQLIQPD